jgi:RNA polymerase sigma-B factor
MLTLGGMVDPLEAESSQEELFARRTEAGVRDQLVERYLPLAQNLARRYQRSGQPIEDLVQIASIGLIKAVDGFDQSRGASFESYAVPTILGELKRYHRDRGWSVRMPRRLQESALLLKDSIPRLSQDLHRSPTIAEIAGHTGLSEEEVLEALDAQEAYASLSLDAPIDDIGEGATLADRVASDDDDLEMVEEWAEFEPHLRRLPERERRIIVLRFFKDWTQSEIAEELGISQMHVSRLLSQTLRTLREAVQTS